MENTTFLLYLSVPTLIISLLYYLITSKRRDKLFNQFQDYRSELYNIQTMEEMKEFEQKVIPWTDKLRLESEKPWRTELFLLMREKRNYFKELEKEI